MRNKDTIARRKIARLNSEVALLTEQVSSLQALVLSWGGRIERWSNDVDDRIQTLESQVGGP